VPKQVATNERLSIFEKTEIKWTDNFMAFLYQILYDKKRLDSLKNSQILKRYNIRK
jgi:hypothetical protein